MAIGRKKNKPISQRGKGERRVTFALSRAKAVAAGFKAPKKRTGPNKSAKKSIAGYKAGKKTSAKKLSKFAKFKLAAKQKALNLKGKTKAKVRKGKKLSAAHRKAISEGLKKRFGFGK